MLGLLSGQEAYSVCYRNTKVDTDCDGLADEWENQKWYDENGDGKKVTLPPSVKSDHKDILVEIDAMADHENLASAINLVKNKFLVAPVSNPDSTMGINLDVILDDKTITHASCTSIWGGFSSLKTSWFGTLSERLSNPNIVSEKEDIYHYGISIHSQCGSGGISGISEQPGNDFVISLGDAGWGDSDGDGHPDGNTNQQAATLMHELGHNLNLKHGGSANTPTCKPNYFSVMNHVYEFAGFVPQALIDYSNVLGRDALNNIIDEANLQEPSGIVGPFGFIGAIGTSSPLPPPNHYRNFNADGSGINFDFVSDVNATETSGVSTSINYFSGYSPCTDTTISGSFGFKDWPSIKYWDPPEEIERISNQIQFQSAQDTNANNTVSLAKNKTIQGTSSNGQINLSGTSENSFLDDPSLPPCDLTDPKCANSPCDPDDPRCKFNIIFNITDPSDMKKDIGNRTAHSEPDVSINDIKNISKSKIFNLDNSIKLNLANLENKTQIINSLNSELISAPNSVTGLIESNNYGHAILKLLKLHSLIDMPNSIIVIDDPEAKYLILRLISDATSQLKNMV